MDEKHQLLQLLKDKWERGDSSLRRIYPSWEDLESNIEIKLAENSPDYATNKKHCPYCGVILNVKKPMDDLFPYDQCKSCKHSFHVSANLDIRKLTDEENENMPAEWVRVLHALDKKKLAIVFKLE
ncbi:MAG: hypothetical protein NWE93_06690 [Candidatus Bathyarchaeota archaeon]|nr:hypothetical protein [Candidatus Bathyarchaeota archaeon]